MASGSWPNSIRAAALLFWKMTYSGFSLMARSKYSMAFAKFLFLNYLLPRSLFS